MITIENLTPEITSFFDRELLSRPKISFSDTSETLRDAFDVIECNLAYKLDRCPGKKKAYKQLKLEFLKLYAEIRSKENEKTESKNITQRPFYRINLRSGSRHKLFIRLKYARSSKGKKRVPNNKV